MVNVRIYEEQEYFQIAMIHNTGHLSTGLID